MKISQGLRRRVLFSLVALALTLALATLVCKVLVWTGRVHLDPPPTAGTHRLNFLRTIQTADGPAYQITPVTTQTRFPVKKAPGTFRIFIAGGSVARGSPYTIHIPMRVFGMRSGHAPSDPAPAVAQLADVPGLTGVPRGEREHDPYAILEGHGARSDGAMPGFGGIPSWLHAMLEMRYSTMKIEVINVGREGANSLDVRENIKELIGCEPDLIIIASGNNEGFLEPSWLKSLVSEWIVYRLLREALMSSGEDGRPMLPQRPPDMAGLLKQYKRNIRQIVAITKEARVPVALATLPIRLKFRGAPAVAFKGQFRPNLEEDRWIREGKAQQQQGNHEEGLKLLAKSDNPALAAFFMGQGYEHLGQLDQAREHYRRYTERLPLSRCRPSYNAFVRELATEEGLVLMDLARVIQEAEPTGLSEALFRDHCHLDWHGYLLMSQEVARQVAEVAAFLQAAGHKGSFPSKEEIIQRYGWQALLKR